MRHLLFVLLAIFTVSACAGTLRTSAPTPIPIVQPTYQPKDGQPPFPPLGQYWVVDNGCHFREEVVKAADAVFEKLQTDGIAEIAVVCQVGVKTKGPTNDELIWLRDWARTTKLGSIEDKRALAWLIRPDVPPEQNRLSIEISQWLYWYTPGDYFPALEEAAMYANFNDFSGALESLARNTDEKLRELWETHQ